MVEAFNICSFNKALGVKILSCRNTEAMFLALVLSVLLSFSEAITTQYGEIQGVEMFGAMVYTQIPYAKPPLGELRFEVCERILDVFRFLCSISTICLFISRDSEKLKDFHIKNKKLESAIEVCLKNRQSFSHLKN